MSKRLKVTVESPEPGKAVSAVKLKLTSNITSTLTDKIRAKKIEMRQSQILAHFGSGSRTSAWPMKFYTQEFWKF